MLNGTTAESDSDPPAPRVLAAMTAVLERLVARNEHLSDHSEGENDTLQRPPPRVLNVFRAARKPSISIEKYLGRIYKYAGCSPACFVVAFAYVDRLLHRHPGFLVVSLNVHRLVLTGVMVASKVLDDVHHDNAFYARVGGVTNAELNALELEMLFQLDFGVMVSSRVFESYCSYLEKEMKWRGLLQKIDRPLSSSIDGEEAQALRRSLLLPEA